MTEPSSAKPNTSPQGPRLTSARAFPDSRSRLWVTHHNATIHHRMDIRSDSPCRLQRSQDRQSHGSSFQSQVPEVLPQSLPTLCKDAHGELGKRVGKRRSCFARNKALPATHVLVSTVTTATPASFPPCTKAGARYLYLSSQFYHLHLNKTSYNNSSRLTHGASYTLQQDFSFRLIFLDLTLRPASAPTTVGTSKS